MKKVHPDEVLRGLTAGSKNPVFLRNMAILQEVCREASSSLTKDYSKAAIGRISEARRGPSLNTLYSPKGKHFGTLIEAWVTWDGAKPKKKLKSKSAELPSDNDVLVGIDDLVVRSYVSVALAERRRLRTEVVTLKALSKGSPSIDLRPQVKENSVQLFEPAAVLSEDELETLTNATDPKWLKDHQLCEGIRGELQDHRGITILTRGALPGIRRLLGGKNVTSESRRKE
jgi:hypothetical protein